MPLEEVNLHQHDDQYKPTQEELNMIKDKMKDPEFMKYMTEYMESMKSEEYRNETEQYLKQMEEEAKKGGDYSFDFIFPRAEYYVELLEVGEKEGQVTKTKNNSSKKMNGTKERVFINICSSEKIDPYGEQPTENKMASNWLVPISIGKVREDQMDGKQCLVYDAVFNPKTIALGERSDKFMTFLVEIIVENINVNYEQSYGYKYVRPCSGEAIGKSVGIPANQTIKKEKGKGAFEVDPKSKPLSEPMKFGKKKESSSEKKTTSENKNTLNDKRTLSRNEVKKEKEKRSNTESDNVDKTKALKKKSLPEYKITHRGNVDILDTWQWRYNDMKTGIPTQLVICMELSFVKRARDFNVFITGNGTCLEIEESDKHPYFGVIVLPFEVEATPAQAQYEVKTKKFNLVLDVKKKERVAKIPQELKINHGAHSSTNCQEEFTGKEEDIEHILPDKTMPEDGKKKENEINKCNSGNDFEKNTLSSATVATNKDDFETSHGTACLQKMKIEESAFLNANERMQMTMAAVEKARKARLEKENETKNLEQTVSAQEKTKEIVEKEKSAHIPVEIDLKSENTKQNAKELPKESSASSGLEKPATLSSEEKKEKQTETHKNTQINQKLDEENNSIVTVSGELDEYEVKARKREKKKVLEEQLREIEEREKRKMDELMKQRMQELPLTTNSIFDIE